MTKIIETTPDIETENAAKLIKRLYEADGWSANIEPQEDGMFTVVATKEDGVFSEKLISGAPPQAGTGINGLLDCPDCLAC